MSSFVRNDTNLNTRYVLLNFVLCKAVRDLQRMQKTLGGCSIKSLTDKNARTMY